MILQVLKATSQPGLQVHGRRNRKEYGKLPNLFAATCSRHPFPDLLAATCSQYP